MTAMTKLQARALLMAAVREAEHRLGFEAGAILSERRHKPVARARQIIMLIGIDECGFTTTQLGRIMRRDHSTCVVGARVAREVIAHEPWRSLHADLVAFVRNGKPLPKPAPEPAAEPAVKSEPVAETISREPPPTGERATPADVWPVWPDREYYNRMNAAFVRAMRLAHPEREIILGGRG